VTETLTEPTRLPAGTVTSTTVTSSVSPVAAISSYVSALNTKAGVVPNVTWTSELVSTAGKFFTVNVAVLPPVRSVRPSKVADVDDSVIVGAV